MCWSPLLITIVVAGPAAVVMTARHTAAISIRKLKKKTTLICRTQKLHGLPWRQRARLVQGSALTGVKGGGLGFQGLTVADSSKHKDWELEEKRKNKRPKWSAVEIN